MDKSVQNGIIDSFAHVPAIHGRHFARCFCRYSGNIASDISYIIKKLRQFTRAASDFFLVIGAEMTYNLMIQTLENKTILEIDIVPGKCRPYYLAKKGKKSSAYIRINGTSRPADARKLQELELEG